MDPFRRDAVGDLRLEPRAGGRLPRLTPVKLRERLGDGGERHVLEDAVVMFRFVEVGRGQDLPMLIQCFQHELGEGRVPIE